MAHVIPFKAIRPTADKAHLVASRPYTTYSKKEREQKLQSNPYTFLHVLKPDYGSAVSLDPNDLAYLKKVKEKFEEFIDKGILVQDDRPSYYIYRQIKNNFSHTGIIGCISIDDYFNGTIKKHENTLTRKRRKVKKLPGSGRYQCRTGLLCIS